MSLFYLHMGQNIVDICLHFSVHLYSLPPVANCRPISLASNPAGRAPHHHPYILPSLSHIDLFFPSPLLSLPIPNPPTHIHIHIFFLELLDFISISGLRLICWSQSGPLGYWPLFYHCLGGCCSLFSGPGSAFTG